MKNKTLTVCLEHRFYLFNNQLFTKLAFSYSYWSDYLQYFNQVVIVARVKSVDFIDSSYKRVDGKSVTFIAMPYYIGVKDFCLNLPRLLNKAYSISRDNNNFLLRSGNITNLIWIFLMINKKSYLREYPGNIKDGINGFGGDKFLIKMLASISNQIAKIQAKYAKANSYVSNNCKQLYSSNNPSYVFSSFNLDEVKIKKNNTINNIPIIISVGRLEKEKGHKDLIKSISFLSFDVELFIIGDGTQRDFLENYAISLGINVKFLGAIVNREKLFLNISKADMFVLPSLTEGMPRALLEAMAIGLPCIGTNVGGIPEVLDEQMLFSPNNATSCADKISKLIANPELCKYQSLRNVDFIRNNYSKKSQDEKKIQFWSRLYS